MPIDSAEAAGLEPEYRNARAVLEAHGAYAQNAETSEVLDAEVAAQKAQDNANEAQREVFESTPTSLAGALRLLRHLADFLDEDDVVNDMLVGDMIGDSVRNAVAVLEREAQSWLHQALAESIDSIAIAKLETALEVLLRVESSKGSTKRMLEVLDAFHRTRRG